MGEIAAKFGAAMQGFWWGLDDHERRMLLIAGVWVTVAVVQMLSASAEERRRRELVDEVSREVERRAAHA